MPNRTVRVTDVAVDGVTAFPPADIARYTQGLIGPAVPLPRIDAARQAILQHYRSAGYVLSTVSANLDVAGKLRFIVTEGRIASVKLDGDIGPAGVQVLRFLNRLTEVKGPINSATLERYLLLAQDVPGITLRAVLQPSADDPGALNLIAEVSRQAVSGLASIDNRAFVQTGPIEGARRARLQQLLRGRREDRRSRSTTPSPNSAELRPDRRGVVHRRLRPESAGVCRAGRGDPGRRRHQRPGGGELPRHHQR